MVMKAIIKPGRTDLVCIRTISVILCTLCKSLLSRRFTFPCTKHKYSCSIVVSVSYEGSISIILQPGSVNYNTGKHAHCTKHKDVRYLVYLSLWHSQGFSIPPIRLYINCPHTYKPSRDGTLADVCHIIVYLVCISQDRYH